MAMLYSVTGWRYKTTRNLAYDHLEPTSVTINWSRSRLDASKNGAYELEIVDRDHVQPKIIAIPKTTYPAFKDRFSGHEYISVKNLHPEIRYKATLRSCGGVFDGNCYGTTHYCYFDTPRRRMHVPATEYDTIQAEIATLREELHSVVTVVLVGEQQAGKSSNINTMYLAHKPWKEADPPAKIAPVGRVSETCTKYSTRYSVEEKDQRFDTELYKVYDTPGLDVRNGIWSQLAFKMERLVNDKLLPGTEDNDTKVLEGDVDIVIYVVNANAYAGWADRGARVERAKTVVRTVQASPRLHQKGRNAPQFHCFATNIDKKLPNVHPDSILASHQWIKVRNDICRKLGFEESCVHPIINYNDETDIRLKSYEKLLLFAMRRILADAKARRFARAGMEDVEMEDVEADMEQ